MAFLWIDFTMSSKSHFLPLLWYLWVYDQDFLNCTQTTCIKTTSGVLVFKCIFLGSTLDLQNKNLCSVHWESSVCIWTHLRGNPLVFLLYIEVWEPLLITFLRTQDCTKNKTKLNYLMPVFSPIVTHQWNICNIAVHILLLYLWKSGSEHFLWQKKKNGWRGQLSYLAEHLRKICDLCVLTSNIYLISLRDGIIGPLTKLRWF